MFPGQHQSPVLRGAHMLTLHCVQVRTDSVHQMLSDSCAALLEDRLLRFKPALPVRLSQYIGGRNMEGESARVPCPQPNCAGGPAVPAPLGAQEFPSLS